MPVLHVDIDMPSYHGGRLGQPFYYTGYYPPGYFEHNGLGVRFPWSRTEEEMKETPELVNEIKHEISELYQKYCNNDNITLFKPIITKSHHIHELAKIIKNRTKNHADKSHVQNAIPFHPPPTQYASAPTHYPTYPPPPYAPPPSYTPPPNLRG